MNSRVSPGISGLAFFGFQRGNVHRHHHDAVNLLVVRIEEIRENLDAKGRKFKSIGGIEA